MTLPLPDDELTAFVRRHQVGVWRYLCALGAAADEAEELCQDVLLVALRRRVQANAETAAAAAFLRTTARHLWLRRRRDDRARAARLATAVEELWRHDCARDDGEELLAALERCVTQLPERSRRLVDGRYRQQRSRAELAAEFGVSEHGIRVSLHRLRRALRECIERRLRR